MKRPAEERDGDEEAEEAPLLPPGNPPRWGRGALVLSSGALVALFLMVIPVQLRWGVPAGALATGLAAFGALDVLGSFDDRGKVAKRSDWLELLPAFALFAGGAGALLLSLISAVEGYVGPIGAGLTVTSSMVITLVGGYRFADRVGVFDDEPRPMLERHGFWLMLACILLYVPMLGSHSLTDPWETHYGEVAREILARDDWISLWWAQDGWFFSKPVLGFWIQSLAMATLGVRYQPGQMLSAVALGRTPSPEWAVRLPVFLLAAFAVYVLYKAMAQTFGRRAGLLSGLVLMTMPQWLFIGHQTMTDMPFVASMSAAMAFFAMGLFADPDREVRRFEVDLWGLRLRVSAFHLVFGAIALFALPQILYLVSRNIHVDLDPLRIRAGVDAFQSGSRGNCGLPGNDPCQAFSPHLRGLHPALQALLWAQALGTLLFVNWGERRVQRLYFIAAWLCAAISTMSKGPAGFGLPVVCALLFVVATGRYRDLKNTEIASGLLVIGTLTLPWMVAMYARHGPVFTDRLLFHDMFKRAFKHVHDTNSGDDVSFRYYVWQLGYATFPWVGLVPAGTVRWLKGPDDADRRAQMSILLVLWAVVAFALFAVMLTKFHHYILPAVPPLALLSGVVLDDLLGDEHPARLRQRLAYAAVIAVGTACLLAGLTRVWDGRPGIGFALATAGALGLWVAAITFGRATSQSSVPGPRRGSDLERAFHQAAIGAVSILGAVTIYLVGSDLVLDRGTEPSQERLIHLFTYRYTRPWPPDVDFTAELWAFVVVAAGLLALAVAPALRRHAAAGLLATGMWFGGFCLNDYFTQVAPHWGQREVAIEYYLENAKDPGPIIAYQMNWKGENFYHGNAVAAFVSSGKSFKDYILLLKKEGHKTFYFFTEHARAGALESELGKPRVYERLTTPEDNNKFLLIRARFE